jgi:iron complex transport system substrate-binding protein
MAAGVIRRVPAAMAALAAMLGAASAVAAKPQRIVSLNLCTDQILVELVPRERIAAVTHLAADPTVSAAPEKAAGLRAVRGEAEQVLRLDPDLVIAGTFTTPATVDLLRRLGREVLVAPLPQDFQGVRDVVRLIGKSVGEEARAEAWLGDFDRRLAAVEARTGSEKPAAVLYQVNSFAAGAGSMADAALSVAGFRNQAAGYGTLASGQLPLEALVARPPDLLVLGSNPEDYPTAVADNLRHPALKRLLAERPSLALPWALWLCGTPHIIGAVERLAEARVSVLARNAGGTK